MIRMSEGESNQPTFKRGVDLLQTGDAVTTRQIVNVLGRWGSHRDWNDAIGRKGKLDELRSGDFYDDDVKALATDFSQPMEYYIPRRPQFLNFCERYGLVARWVHGENVGELPFTDAKLAASIGATIEELNAEPVDAVAAEVVFDALSGSAAGFVLEEECDARRAAFLDVDGGFDAAAFGSALGDTRRNLLGVYVFGPGLGLLAMALVAYHWLPTLLESTAAFNERLVRNYDAAGPAILVLPIISLGALGAQLLGFTPAYERDGGMGMQGSMLDMPAPSSSAPSSSVTSSSATGSSATSSSATSRPGSSARPAAGRERGFLFEGERSPDGRALNWQEVAIRKQDELFMEQMLAKRRGVPSGGEGDDEGATPKMDDDTVREYFEKQWASGFKAIFPFFR